MPRPTGSRFDALAAVKPSPARNGGGAAPGAPRPKPIEEIFGQNVFNLAEMKARLPKAAFTALVTTIEEGKPLDAGIAEAVAIAMRDWAIEKGATHYTHWFQPLTGATAEKHDSFLAPTGDGRAIAQFNATELVQGEPDASSFPSGGLRATFEARGYTAWDPTSPAFVLEGPGGAYLAIPTAFASWTGDALDQKTPLLRSIQALDEQARRALRLFGAEVTRVQPTCGAEQEFFLIDEEFAWRRPDLINCGRTLFGAKPPRGQEMDDHYFGSIPERVLDYMNEVERELYLLGVPLKTRHNEVAPAQYEMAPIFEDANTAADHQQLTMNTLRRVARRYGLACLLHEKPFAGVNGSGKHLNWSFGTEAGNLLDPGETPHGNVQFLFFCAAVLRAVERHQDLLRASIAFAGNDHRLGANEAPPSIISVFLGDQLTDVYEQIESAGHATESHSSGILGLGVDTLPDLPRHAGDRNRTSPFAFTGNKFEFRALGASQSISFPATVLNTIVAESIDEMTTEVESAMEKGTGREDAIRELLAREARAFKRIIFNGDGYSEAWVEEAERRGLLNLRSTMDALSSLVSEKNATTFERYRVLNRRELESRHEILTEQYFHTVNIEGETAADMAQTMIIPAATRYLSELLQAAERAVEVGVKVKGVTKTVERVASLIDEFREAVDHLVEENAELGGDTVYEKAEHMRADILPALTRVRVVADQLEKLVPDDIWPIPTYRDMLHVK
ncbi:MAG: glutamine synthetase III [Longimicrobiales bacterium]|nr:glutamine synthetase III [Longimicrobiales bacterium]